jgi:hypothetical protein
VWCVPSLSDAANKNVLFSIDVGYYILWFLFIHISLVILLKVFGCDFELCLLCHKKKGLFNWVEQKIVFHSLNDQTVEEVSDDEKFSHFRSTFVRFGPIFCCGQLDANGNTIKPMFLSFKFMQCMIYGNLRFMFPLTVCFCPRSWLYRKIGSSFARLIFDQNELP